MNEDSINYLLGTISDLHTKVAYLIAQNSKLEKELEKVKGEKEDELSSEV